MGQSVTDPRNPYKHDTWLSAFTAETFENKACALIRSISWSHSQMKRISTCTEVNHSKILVTSE